jgi:2-amino-4-hydroxy-6-hydroxymethyldihydropteridine diphosphokinase
MSTCLIALGSNLGDRAAMLGAAIGDIGAISGTQIQRHSRWYPTQATGCVEGGHEFLNGAALCETSLPPEMLLGELQAIEARHGRQRIERWADRTLDLDVLIYDEMVFDIPGFTVPHPRMSFRRFVLEPAAEIAGELLHPTIGWTLNRLLQHLDTGADCIAIVSPNERCREQLTELLINQFPAALVVPRPDLLVERLWPVESTAWVSVQNGSDSATVSEAGTHPKLTILLDPTPDDLDGGSFWMGFCLQRGRGPTLQIRPSSVEGMSMEALAAVQAVWPALGPSVGKRLE